MRKHVPNPAGRPHKRGELNDVQHPVKMPESLMQQLRERRTRTGVPIGTQIRQAIERDLAAEEKPETPPDVLTIHIKPEEQEQLRALIRPFGYRVLEHWIEDIALRSLDKAPRAVQEYMLGEFLQRGEAAAAKERARLQALDEQARERELSDNAPHKRNGKAA